MSLRRSPAGLRHPTAIAAAIVLILLLQACSTIRFAYDNLPEIGYWWLDAYADFDEAQTLRLRADLVRLQQWHRTDELPRLAELLARARTLAGGDPRPEEVCSLATGLRTRIETLIAQIEPAALAIATTLDARQIAHIEARYAKKNAEWREEWLSGSVAERRERRLKTAVERAEQFYGRLDERQIEILRTAIQRSSFDPERSDAERQRRQQDLLQTLRRIGRSAGTQRAGEAEAAALLHATLERSLNSPVAAYRAATEKGIEDACTTISTLHRSASPEQRERALRRIAAYERDARELALRP